MYGGCNSYAGGALPAYGEAFDPQADGVSMKSSPFARGPRRNTSLFYIVACIFVPWMLFTGVFYLNSMDIRYSSPDIVMVGLVLLGSAVVAQGYFAVMAWWRKGEGVQDHFWYTLGFVTSVIAFAVGFLCGEANYTFNMLPYFDVQSLNTYRNVDPSVYRGQQLMDAGNVFFSPGTYLDLRKSMGFMNFDTYCVVPITIGNLTRPPLESYDFWAVGVNCCSGHGNDFQCNNYLNPQALAGLRLMRDDQRSYFRLAVQQAEAAYNIRATHPIFFHWLEDPSQEISAYQESGNRNLLFGVLLSFVCQLIVVMLAAASIGF